MKKYLSNLNPVFKKGFTLLEMLVVIGIIAVLVTLSITSYTTVQKKARDAKRKSDLKAIQNCLEQHYAYDNKFKYSTAGLGESFNSNANLNCGGTSELSPFPTDPINNDTYKYVLVHQPTLNDQTYTVMATLEQGTAPDNTFTITNQQ